MNTTATISLYDDWETRRARLLSPTVQANLPAAVAHVKVLEFLLRRYHGTAIVQRAAMFPLPRDVVLNQRAIIVNHHLGSRRVAGVKSAEEAESRVSSILRRMTDSRDDTNTDEPWPGESTLWTPATRRAGHRIEDRYLALGSEDSLDRAAALDYFRRRGTLQDTSLMSDLASLPGESDLSENERVALLSVMKRIGLRGRE